MLGSQEPGVKVIGAGGPLEPLVPVPLLLTTPTVRSVRGAALLSAGLTVPSTLYKHGRKSSTAPSHFLCQLCRRFRANKLVALTRRTL